MSTSVTDDFGEEKDSGNEDDDSTNDGYGDDGRFRETRTSAEYKEE